MDRRIGDWRLLAVEYDHDNPEMSSRSDSYSQCVQGGNFMRMSLMFAAVTLLTGINLFFIPFQPVPALWGAILAVAFVLINVVADKLRLWSGIAWIIVAGIIITLMLKGKEPGDELRGRGTVFVSLPAQEVWCDKDVAVPAPRPPGPVSGPFG
jgi:hypothetical protein